MIYKKIFSFLLALCMVLSLPAAVSATDVPEGESSGGGGPAATDADLSVAVTVDTTELQYGTEYPFILKIKNNSTQGSIDLSGYRAVVTGNDAACKSESLPIPLLF